MARCLAGLAMGLLIGKRSQNEKQSVFFSPYFFKVVTTNGKIIAKSDSNYCILMQMHQRIDIYSKWLYS